MSEGSEAEGTPHTFTETELAAIGAYLPELQRYVSGQRILYRSLGIGFVVGLAAHIVGYVLGLSATTVALGLLADLLHALGWALWTGAVVALFVQILPEAKRRQIERGLEAYEAAQREKARTGSDQALGDDGAPAATGTP